MEKFAVTVMSSILLAIFIPPYLTIVLFGVILKKTWYYLISKTEND